MKTDGIALTICPADYGNPTHMQAVLALLDAYARDPAGGGQPLSDYALTHLPQALRERPTLFSVLAFDHDVPVGLVNCVEGFSSFASRPLVNVHDVVVTASHRGQGVAARMLRQVEDMARARGACKLTLEVLSGNAPATRLYRQLGFENYQLDPAMGHALFMHKAL